ncbi:unnamed protein product [Eruca vesicaria subsp. sativa]|uniref:Uncharacterized protein n=1 Tax=Eruca vesicaria subsp. sativa TaxID=29727 RepID=A0ABC8JVS3_ERUVS|nr:unnamed protein product [Eruca vesicaria subsp. sativa]
MAPPPLPSSPSSSLSSSSMPHNSSSPSHSLSSFHQPQILLSLLSNSPSASSASSRIQTSTAALVSLCALRVSSPPLASTASDPWLSSLLDWSDCEQDLEGS